jgi:hypothetical protein
MEINSLNLCDSGFSIIRIENGTLLYFGYADFISHFNYFLNFQVPMASKLSRLLLVRRLASSFLSKQSMQQERTIVSKAYLKLHSEPWPYNHALRKFE